MQRRSRSLKGINQFINLTRVGVAALLLVAVLGILPLQRVHAASIVVNTLADEDNSNGNCSLREAIHAANNDAPRDACTQGSGADVINLTGLAGTITLTLGELSIDKDLTINGPGADQLTISGNHANRVFGIAPSTVVVISDITIANGNNSVDDGGGITNLGTLTINRCTFSGNQTANNGGGIANSGTATINRSTFYDNQAELNGGGIGNFEGTMTVNNSTFSGNRASEAVFDNYGGGGISNMSEGDPAVLTINNSTIAFNSAKWGGGVDNNNGIATIRNTVVAENTVHTGGSGPNCANSGTVTSSYNLESGTDCGFTGTGDLQSADADLETLQNNGGTTWTHALLGESQAINNGSCTDSFGNPVGTDQRGVKRLGSCDIGAFEYVLQVYLPFVRRE